jgi:DNA-binding winged helix-turn-helix (wHTH) protein
MTSSSGSRCWESGWFRALIDLPPDSVPRDVYFRYSLEPPRRFVYLSPAVEQLTRHTPADFYADAALCFRLFDRDGRRALKQAARARRPLAQSLQLRRDHVVTAVLVQTVAVVRNRRVVAVEGVIRVNPSGVDASTQGGGECPPSRPGLRVALDQSLPIQQRLTALLVEVHSLLHNALPNVSTGALPIVRLGDLVFDEVRMTAEESGERIALTGKELLLLRYLLQRRDRIVTREQLLTEVWGHAYTGDDRTVDVHISRLRRKLPSLRARLVAIKNVGYRLEAREEQESVAV